MQSAATGEQTASAALLRHGVLLLAATQLIHVANLAFQYVLMRSLEHDAYGAAAALLGSMLVISPLTETLRMTVAQQAASQSRSGPDYDGHVRIVRSWSRRIGWWGLVVVTSGLLFAGPVSERLRIYDAFSIFGVAVTLALSLYVPIYAGVLQGMQLFGRLALIGQAFALGRLMAFGSLRALGAVGAWTVVWSEAAGVFLAYVAGRWGWRDRLRQMKPAEQPPAKRESRESATGAHACFTRMLPAMVAFGILLNSDVMLARMHLPPDEAGMYSRAAVIARAVVFLPMPVALVAFPKLIAASDRRNVHALTRASFLFVLFLLAVGASATWMGGPGLWQFLTGRPPPATAIRLLRTLPLAVAPLGTVYWQLHRLFAVAGRVPGWIMLAIAALYVFAGAPLLKSPLNLVGWTGAASWGCMLMLAGVGGRHLAGTASRS